MNISVNGKNWTLDPVPGEMLSDLLRVRLGLTGTKIVCNEDECGACTVIINGKPIFSCTYPSSKADGKNILTIEGLGTSWKQSPRGTTMDPALHPLQDAFVKHGAVQCGFCIPGQIMTAYALLQENLGPTAGPARGPDRGQTAPAREDGRGAPKRDRRHTRRRDR